jgi:hypothetical protein
VKKLIPLIIILGLLGYGAYYISISNKLSEPVVENKQISYGSEEEKYTIIADYPVIQGGIPKIAMKNINESVYSWAASSAEISHSEFQEIAKDPIAVPDHATLSYVSQYKTKQDFNFAPYINFQFDTYTYTGGAHGITGISTLVFNASNGKLMTENDIFEDGYLEELSQLSLIEIRKIDPDLETYIFAESGLKPVLENFAAWQIMPEGLKITFGHYQIGPYTVGSPEVTLTWQSLSSVLKPEFINALKLAR